MKSLSISINIADCRLSDLSLSNRKKNVLTQAGGEVFPVWNTIAGKDKVDRLSICGRTAQQGIPKPDAPAQFQSAGDSGLILTVAPAPQGGAGQTFSFGDIVLRSLPNGVRDEIVYENGVWKHIQRVGILRATQRPQWGTGYDTESNSVVCGFWVLPESDALLGIYDAAICNRLTRSATNSNVPKSVNEFAVGQSSVGIYMTARFTADIFTGLEEGLTKNNQLIIASWLQENPLYFAYPLVNPVVTGMDLPLIPTFAGETWFSTNQAEVKPRMSADIKVKNAIRPAKSPFGQWDVLGRTNADTNRAVIPDQSGNGNNFSLSGFGYIPGSGFDGGVLECDGVDDLATLTLPVLESSEKTLFMVLAPMLAPQTSIRAYTFLGAEICSLTPSGIVQFLSDSSAGYSLIQSPVGYYDYSKSHVLCFSRIGNNAKGYIDGNLIGENSDFRDKPWAQYLYIGGVATVKYPLNFIAAVLYNRMLSDQEIQQTTNFLQQKYGI